MECHHLSKDFGDGLFKNIIIQECCEHPDVGTYDFKCPYGPEIECGLRAHMGNMGRVIVRWK